jgi:hypothetical protein
MGFSVGAFLSMRTCRRIAVAMAATVLFAGIAQAAHYHRDDLARPASTDVHCLLCLYAAGAAGPATVPALVRPAGICARAQRFLHCIGCVEDQHTASYDARGPPIG